MKEVQVAVRAALAVFPASTLVMDGFMASGMINFDVVHSMCQLVGPVAG